MYIIFLHTPHFGFVYYYYSFFCKKQNESPALASLDSHSPAACWSTCGHCSPGQPDRKGGDVGQIGGGGKGGNGEREEIGGNQEMGKRGRGW